MSALVTNLSTADYTLETPVRNYRAAGYREVIENGRTYLVAPMTMIVPGVLNGSKGRLYYPPEEVGKDPTPWNGVPITHRHPSLNGRPVSVKDLPKDDPSRIGVVRSARTGNKLKAEAWIDVERANKANPSIVKAVRNGVQMEISTGLYTDNHPAPAGSHHRGRKYDYVARNYRPDHLAILPDERGACSVSDGCGLGVNSKNPSSKLDLSSDKACKILKDGEINGHPLTKAQRGMFGAKCGSSKVHNMANEEYEVLYVYNDRWPQKKRDELDESDFAGPHQSFPIKTQKDVNSAARLIGHADDPESVKRRIKSIAKRKGLTLPESWATENSNPEGHNQYSGHKSVALAATARASTATMAVGSKNAKSEVSAIDKQLRYSLDKHPEAHGHIASLHKSAAIQSGTRKDPVTGRKLSELHMEAAKAHKVAYESHMAHNTEGMDMETKFFLTENALSHEELKGKLGHALRSKLTQNDPMPYIHEVHDDHVKYDHGGKMMKCNYKMTDNDEVRMGKAKELKRVVTYEEAEPSGSEHASEVEVNGNQDGTSPSTISTRKGGIMAKLTANQRTAVIDTLISNEGCGCYNEEDKEYLQGLSDNRLTELQDKHEKHLATNADPEDDDDEETEKIQQNAEKGKKGKKPVENVETKPKKRMTVNEFRETAPVEYLEAVDEATAVLNEKKTEIITKLTANVKDKDLKARITANYSKKSLADLKDDLAVFNSSQPAAPTKPTRMVFGPTGNRSVTEDPVANDEEDVMVMAVRPIDFTELSKELNTNNHKSN